MNELKPEDVVRALELKVQRHLMPNVDIDGTVSVEDAERWFLKLLKEELAPYVSALLREKDAHINKLELTLEGVMWSVDKWLDEADYDKDEVKRALTMREKTLRIVEEKDAEIERLREIIVKGDYSSHTARLVTETWHRNNSEFIRRLEAKIERLSHHCDDCAGCTQWKCDCSNIRAEAIDEFAHRLKKFYGKLGGKTVGGSVEYHIDQIAKEMKGDQDA